MSQLDLNTKQIPKLLLFRIATDEKCFTFDIHYNNLGCSKQCYIVFSRSFSHFFLIFFEYSTNNPDTFNPSLL